MVDGQVGGAGIFKMILHAERCECGQSFFGSFAERAMSTSSFLSKHSTFFPPLSSSNDLKTGHLPNSGLRFPVRPKDGQLKSSHDGNLRG
jgi:hypothetical protein